MLTKEEIMEVFSGRGCQVEDKAKDENWFFYTREGIHYEVQIAASMHLERQASTVYETMALQHWELFATYLIFYNFAIA